ncbi:MULTISPECIES: type VI secretion system baseplate subunit TssE [Francisella]|uniref:25-like lysozyme family protein n=2 Tax=Francisella TaxID=262 RepID=A0A080Q8Q9_9GAMM|nr:MULTISPECIES: type VI secretion system baseplate subunit TssE [Francisella]AJI53609.1 25-like lysozyme family protein [Francisella philomiragia]KFJ43434.1 25-like lysozyme family protein [Francisella philomiragia]MBK2255656.1 type VI secretion system baseplate subunit TssE [Francisella philomiragia]MBK2259530.1 type VI secretion system baseplate subunit TssE [Francisella philomiragia]MBK2273969.1 type VI secretion system baseplate subunit TssE [Francisella philomiragia]
MHAKSLFNRIKSQDFSYSEAGFNDLLSQISTNLELLLNTKQGATLIDLEYGIPDFNGITHNIYQELSALEKEIIRIVNKYEKRMQVKSIKTTIDSKKNPGQILFILEGYVLYQNKKHYIEYQTVMTDTGRVMVRSS